MAGKGLRTPDSFNFQTPDQWPRWKKSFEQYRLASGLSKETKVSQVNTLLYCMGSDSEDTLRSTGITDDELAEYSDVMKKFDEHFGVRANPIYERARLGKRCQEPGETAEQYILALYTLAENCRYSSLAAKEETICDRLVIGMRNANLSQRLQMDSKLTLDSAKKSLHQAEAVSEQHQTLLQGERRAGDSKSNPIQLDSVRRGRDRSRRSRSKLRSRKSADTTTAVKKQTTCTRCGCGLHSCVEYPAREATCHRCSKKGHFSSQCFSKHSVLSHSAAAIEEVLDADVGAYFLDAVTLKDKQTAWTATVLVGSQEVTFKLDTGAGVTAISEDVYRSLKTKAHLNKPTKLLYGPDHKELHVLGQFRQTLSYNQKTSKQQIFVVKELRTNLLGLPAIISLSLAARLDAVDDYHAKVLAAYPNIFTGLGNLGEPYKTELSPDAKPHAILTPRRVPYPL